jgi:2-furoate---CoA ligase
MQTGYDLIWIAAERTPNHIALVDDKTGKALTYRELLYEVDVIATGLAERGIKAGSRVATALPNLFDHCLVLLALQRLAAVPALMNFRLPVDQLATLIRQGEMVGAVILDDPALTPAVSAELPADGVLLTVGDSGPLGENLSSCRGDAGALPEWRKPDPDDAAFIFYTSGTTGAPRGVVVAHRTTEHRIVWLSTQAGLRHGTHLRTLGMMPVSHAIGFYCTFLVTLAYNGTFFTMSAFNPVSAVDLIERHKINYLFAVPTIYQALVNATNYHPERVRSLELVLFGGGPMPSALLDRMHAEWPATLRHIYGTTEIMCGLYNPDPVGNPLTLRPGFYSRVRVVRIGGDTEDRAAPGEPGELIVDATGDSIFSGYLNQPEVTAAKVRNGWYYTGDVCVPRRDGDVDLIGRVDDMIRSGGESIYPEEVEAVLSMYPSVREVCVIGIPDPLWGEIAVACVVGNGPPLDWRDLDAHCCSGPLARFKRPKVYFVMKAIPRNAATKPLRRALREMAIQASQDRQHGDFFSVAA